MTDQELAVALYADGMRPTLIAEKLETDMTQILHWIERPPGRPKTVESLILSAIGDNEMTLKQVAASSGVNAHNLKTYLFRLQDQGKLVRRQGYSLNRSSRAVWHYRVAP